MNRAGWDGPETHRKLDLLNAARSRFRIRRTLNRIRSPRRLLATSMTIAFFAIYLLNGIFILSARAPADPERLRLWLSGGMVIYALYHCLRCAWSTSTSDLELTEAENLWLGGAPVHRSSLAVYHVGGMVWPTLLKTLLLAVVLFRDVEHVELLVLGVFTSLLLLEISRLIIFRWAAGLDEKRRQQFRFAISLVGLAGGVQVIAGILATTPSGSATWLYLLNGFRSLGQLASTDLIQWLSMPWIPASYLSVTLHYQWLTLAQMLASAAVLPLAIWTFVRVDLHSSTQRHRAEQQRLESGRYRKRLTGSGSIEFSSPSRLLGWVEQNLPVWVSDATSIVLRQSVTVNRYRATIAFSFFVPTLLCLSPLLTGQVKEQWFYVVGGIALCTMLLAPPALRIDFRRDVRRMLLLRSLPVKPLSMVLGQISLPILITWVFQWITIGIAAIVIVPACSQILLWTGLLNALAVFTFATENALFLAYPHHERSEGVAMMVRAKLTFLGKGTVILIALFLLVVWAALCQGFLPARYTVTAFVCGAIVSTWGIAIAALATATICWRRFDAGVDIPPQ